MLGDDGFDQIGKVFLCVSCAAGSCRGCRGRTDSRRKPRRRSIAPTLRSAKVTLNRALITRALSRRQRACRHWPIAVPSEMIKISYSGYRFPPEIIQHAIWLYIRFTLSFRDVEDLLAERGIMVSYETVRRWVNHFGPKIAADLRKRRPKPHTIWHLDEVYLKIDGRMVYLWRAVDAEGEVLAGPDQGGQLAPRHVNCSAPACHVLSTYCVK